MKYFGRIVGTVLALLAFKNLIGALIGFAIGYYFDRAFAKVINANLKAPDDDVPDIKALFMPFMFTALGHLAKVDGRISEAEIQRVEDIMKHYGFDTAARDEAIRCFQDGAKQENHFDELLNAFVHAVRNKPDVKKIMLELLISLALADGLIHPKEESLLLKIAVALGVHERVFQLLLNQLKGQKTYSTSTKENALEQAYKALGVNESDDMDVIKKAYRRLMSEHHPDKLIAQGVPEEVIKIATEKVQIIQSAYELIKKQRQ
jgi:DnaJ like chaperone protein